MKMKDRNSQLKAALNAMPVSKENFKAAYKVPNPDTHNVQGHAAYKIEDTLNLIMKLNTLKLEPQFYKSEIQQMKDIQELIERVAAAEGPYFVCQAIVWSRCKGEGMRAVNNLAAALVAPLICGEEYAKRFFGLWDKKAQKGGCIFRPDDMAEIKDVYNTLNSPTLTNAMKKGFASALEKLDSYSLFKYKKVLVDIANLAHPAARNSLAEITLQNGEKIKALVAMMTGQEAKADTWETAQSEAGQEVAKAVKAGKLSEEKAKEVLAQAKSDNWKSLLEDGKLGILACLRNIRNMLEMSDPKVITMACDLVSDVQKLRQGKIMPYQVDFAYESIKAAGLDGPSTRKLMGALEKGMIESVSNLSESLPGKTLVIIDQSGSMGTPIRGKGINENFRGWGAPRGVTSCAQKAGLIAAMIAKSVNADVLAFGNHAVWKNYNPNDSLFSLAEQFGTSNLGGTYMGCAFDLITRERKAYDRIIILSDAEVNMGSVVNSYKSYIRSVANPYIYVIDLAAYGTAPIKGDKVNIYGGYGYAMFDDISNTEFNPASKLDEIRKIVI